MKKGKKRSKARTIVYSGLILLFLVFVAVLTAGIYMHCKGLRLWSDARPSPKQVKEWTLKNFDPSGYQVWNKNPEFNDIEFDTGLMKESTILVIRNDKDGSWHMRKLARDENAVIIAPKEGAWGVQIYGWEIDGAHEYAPNASRIQSANGIYKIYTKITKKGLYGNGAAIQGWLWDTPENTPWHSPQPLMIDNKKMVLDFTVKINKVYTDTSRMLGYDWQLLSVSSFFTSPELEKPLVIDLAYYLNRNQMYSRESDEDYHYQRVITLNKNEAIGNWRTYTLDFSWFINDALQRFHIEHAADTLQIESLEILSETMYGECEFEVDSLFLYYKELPLCNCGEVK